MTLIETQPHKLQKVHTWQ